MKDERNRPDVITLAGALLLVVAALLFCYGSVFLANYPWEGK